MDAVTIENLTFSYPDAAVSALRDVSLSIPAGSFVCVVGANGGGKTTLLSAIRGFVPHFTEGELTGTVTVNGKNVARYGLGELAGDVGYVFQNPFTQMSGVTTTVFDELAYGLGNLGVSPEETVQRVEAVIAETGLEELRDRDPLQLSGGQQQRVALASVLVMDQPVIVMDEPTSQLDPTTTDDVFDLVLAARARGRTIVLVEHKMEQIAEHADRVVLLHEGAVALEGTPAAVFADPRCEELGTRLPESMYLRRALAARGLAVPDASLTTAALIDSLRTADAAPRAGTDRITSRDADGDAAGRTGSSAAPDPGGAASAASPDTWTEL